MKVGILGGSFNPIHLGHLILTEQARDVKKLDKMLFIPAFQPPHKASGAVISAEHRMRMVELAVEENPNFEPSDIELRRKGMSFTIDTILALQKDRPGDDFYFLIGGDSLPELPLWHRIRELADRCKFIVGDRPGHALNWYRLESALLPRQIELIRSNVVQMPPIGISSTDIRQRVSENRSIKYLVPAAVEDYIYQNDLYKQQTPHGAVGACHPLP